MFLETQMSNDLYEYAVSHRDMVPHLTALRSYAKEVDTIIEMGTRGGVSTWAMLDGLPRNGRLWSIDITPCEVPGRVYMDPRWTFVLGDDTDPFIQSQVPSSADLVFIDTSHEYEHTKVELEWALSLGPKRILCHDAEWDGVARAVNEFCEDHHWSAVIYPASDEKGPFGLAVLEPR
jgi:predicted O-methyltransferase YrrM